MHPTAVLNGVAEDEHLGAGLVQTPGDPSPFPKVGTPDPDLALVVGLS